MVRKFVLSAQKPTGRNGQYSPGGMTCAGGPVYQEEKPETNSFSSSCLGLG